MCDYIIKLIIPFNSHCVINTIGKIQSKFFIVVTLPIHLYIVCAGSIYMYMLLLSIFCKLRPAVHSAHARTIGLLWELTVML